MTQESTIEDYLVKRIKALGGVALKGAVPGTRFIDRIGILPDGVTLWVECKRPSGGRRSALQEERIRQLLYMGHLAFFVKTRQDVDLILAGTRTFYDGELVLWTPERPHLYYRSTPVGLLLR